MPWSGDGPPIITNTVLTFLVGEGPGLPLDTIGRLFYEATLRNLKAEVNPNLASGSALKYTVLQMCADFKKQTFKSEPKVPDRIGCAP